MNRRPVLWGIAAMLLSWGVIEPARAEETVTLFVTSMKTGTVNVYRGQVPDLAFVRSIPVGRELHNLGISPDGRWMATGNRRSGEVSIIDTESLEEVARIPVGHQPHDVAFTSDSRTLYVGHEQELYASVIEVGSRKRRPPLEIGRAQHDLSISPDDKELWFTVTNRPYRPGDPRVGVVDLATGNRVTLVLGTIQLGKYPFHSPKRGRDGNYVPANAAEMWFSDHGLKAAHALSLTDMRVIASVPVGMEPYHLTATRAGILFVANHRSSTVAIIDGARRVALGVFKVPPGPHGVAVLVHPPDAERTAKEVPGK